MKDILQALKRAEAEIVQLTTRDETPGLRYFEFWSKTMGFDVAVGVNITADKADDRGAFWCVALVEVWVGAYNLTGHLSGSTSVSIEIEAGEHIWDEINSPEARKRAEMQVLNKSRSEA